MIDLENLNNQNFSDIVEAAKKQIAHLSDDWTNTQESDPGITLIELFAWLKIVQHDYMNLVRRPSQYKFLELLDIKREHNKGAKTLLQVSGATGDILLPKGTKWCAGEIEFENMEPQMVLSSKIMSIEFGGEEGVLSADYNHFDGKRIFYLFGESFDSKQKKKDIYCTVNFDRPIAANTKFSLYFKSFLEKDYKRNPVSADDSFVDMAKVVWEFYGERNGEIGWHRIRVISDQTHRFLFSGIVTLQFNGKMKARNDMYSIRVRLIDQNYDFPPRITEIKTNVFEVVEKSTMCETTLIKKGQVTDEGYFSVCTNLALYGKHQVYVRVGHSWKIVDEYIANKKIREGKTEFYIENLRRYITDYEMEDDVVMVISFDETIEPEIILGNGTGVSAQEFTINQKNISYDDFDLIVGYQKDGGLLFDRWNKVEDFFSSQKEDQDYVLDCEKGKITFGDHKMGQAPRKGTNNIRISGFATTLGRNSNIKAGMISSVKSENGNIKELKIEQICSASGGTDAENFDDVKAKAANILNNNQKAVTVEDYERIAKETPGLVIKSIKVLPSYLPGKMDRNLNCVTIVVRGGNEQRDATLHNYEQNIKKHIDRYRLINTKVFVTGPTYIGLTISGQIVVNSYYRKSANVISESIRTFVEELNKNCGETLYYGDLFGLIDRLDCVSYVDKLYITPQGDYVDRTAGEDIIIPPNGVYYIDKLDLNYIKSANI